jgi:hypothetical protein
MSGDSPVVIAYDGSELSRKRGPGGLRTVCEASGVAVDVWEPGLGAVAVGRPTRSAASAPLPPDPVPMAAVDREQHEHASRVAAEGAELARSVALAAEAQAVRDEVDVADTLLAIAGERDAAWWSWARRDLGAALACARERGAEADRALRSPGLGDASCSRRLSRLRRAGGRSVAGVDLTEIKQEGSNEPRQAAARLRELADQLAPHNDLGFERDGMAFKVRAPDELQLKVESGSATTAANSRSSSPGSPALHGVHGQLRGAGSDQRAEQDVPGKCTPVRTREYPTAPARARSASASRGSSWPTAVAKANALPG